MKTCTPSLITRKKNYYTIQENKENKIKHNNIVDYVQIRDVFRNFWDHLT